MDPARCYSSTRPEPEAHLHSDETLQFYDALAASYYEYWRDNQLNLPLLESLIARLPHSPSVLDIGCGPGCESKRLANLGARVVGVDLSTKALAIARRHAPEVTFLEMDVRRLDFPHGSFDAVFDAAVLFHFSDAEQGQILASVRQVLKDHGLLLSIYLTGDYCGMQERTVDGSVYRRYVNRKSIEAWTDAVRSAGFRLEAPTQAVDDVFQSALFSAVSL
jgi:SAM-dependent methyltransferase